MKSNYKSAQTQKPIFQKLSEKNKDYIDEYDNSISYELLQLLNNFNELEDKNSEEALDSINTYIKNNFECIDPIIFIKSNFINTIIELFGSPSINTFGFVLSILYDLIKFPLICEYCVKNTRIIEIIESHLKNIPNVNLIDDIFDILISITPTFIKLKDPLLLPFEAIRNVSSPHSILRFINECCKYYSSDLIEDYVSIVSDVIERIELTELNVNRLFGFLYLSVDENHSNDVYIFSKNIEDGIRESLFDQIFKYYQPTDKINEIFLAFCIIIFKYSKNCLKFELSENVNGPKFFLDIIKKTNNEKVVLMSINALNALIYNSCFVHEEIEDQINLFDDESFYNMDNFVMFCNFMSECSYSIGRSSFIIIYRMILYENPEFLEHLCQIDGIQILMNYLQCEPLRVLIIIETVLSNSLKGGENARSIAERICELELIEETEQLISIEEESGELEDELHKIKQGIEKAMEM